MKRIFQLIFALLTTDPTAPDGSIWYNTTLGKFRKKQGGVVSDLDTTGGGGGATISNAIDLDFSNENTDSIVIIANTELTNANIKGVTFLPQETAVTRIDEFVANAVTFSIGAIIDNTSFEIRGQAPNGASGIHTIKYIITY